MSTTEGDRLNVKGTCRGTGTVIDKDIVIEDAGTRPGRRWTRG